MTDLHVLAAQPRAYSGRELTDAVGRRAFDAAVRRGEIVRLARGIYAGVRHQESPWVLASVVALESGGAVTGRGALVAWGALLDAPRRLMVVMPAHRHLRRDFPGVQLLRTRHDVPLSTARGMRVAEPEWALVHAMRECSGRDALAVALEALSSGIVAPQSLAEIVRGLRRTPRRGVLFEALDSYSDGARSILEHTALRDVLVGESFDSLRWQWPVRVGDRRFHIDAFHAESAVAFEFDGMRFHATPERWMSDRERDTLLASLGIQTVRFTRRDLIQRPEWCRVMAQAVIDGRMSGVWADARAA